MSSGADERLVHQTLEVLSEQLQLRGLEQRTDVVEERGFLHAVPPQRVKHAAGIARLEAVLPSQGFLRGIPDRAANQLAKLDVRTRGRPRPRRACGRRDAELVGAGAGGQIE